MSLAILYCHVGFNWFQEVSPLQRDTKEEQTTTDLMVFMRLFVTNHTILSKLQDEGHAHTQQRQRPGGKEGKRTMQNGKKAAWKLYREEKRTAITASTDRAIKRTRTPVFKRT